MEAGLTVVVPVWNREGRIAQTLDSIARGSCLPRQLIVVDNGSTDATAATCRAWQTAHASLPMRITVLAEARRGASFARNSGLSAVQTEWVYFFDSDDDFDSAFTADVMEICSSSAHGVDVVFLPVVQEIGGRFRPRAYCKPLTPSTQILSAMLATQNVVYRTEWLLTLGGWNTSLTTWDDWELGVRVAMSRPRVAWLTRRAYHRVYVHASSLTGTGYGSRRQQILAALRAVGASVGGDGAAMVALYLRSQIVAGTLLCEGDDASGVMAFAAELSVAVGRRHRLAGWLLRRYVSHGWRGAWRLALLML